MEREYYGRTCRIVVDLYHTICRDCLQNQLPPSQCHKAAGKIRSLRPAHLNVTRRVGIRGDYGECGMPLMYILASSACGSLPTPTSGWGKSPITGTGIGNDIERMMSAHKDMIGALPDELISVVQYRYYIDIAREICTRLDTINAVYVTKSFSSSYEQELDALEKLPMNQTTQDKYVETMREMFEEEREISIERERFFRLSRIVVDLNSMFYRDILDKQLPSAQCSLAASKIKVLKMDQKLISRNVSVTGSYRECDISLMYIFLRNACTALPSPTLGWDQPVPHSAVGVADDIERIRQMRNKAFGHVFSTPVSEVAFKQYIQTARDICTRMDSSHAVFLNKSVTGRYVDELNKMEHEVLDNDLYRICVEELARSAQNETKILSQIKDCVAIGKSTHKKVTGLVNAHIEMQKDIKETKNKVETVGKIGGKVHEDIEFLTEMGQKTQKSIKSITKLETKNRKDLQDIKTFGKDTKMNIKSLAKIEKDTKKNMNIIAKLGGEVQENIKDITSMERDIQKDLTNLTTIGMETKNEVKEIASRGMDVQKDLKDIAGIGKEIKIDVHVIAKTEEEIRMDMKDLAKVVTDVGKGTQSTVMGIEKDVKRLGKIVEDTHKKETKTESRNKDNLVLELQTSLEKIHRDTLQSVPLNPLQKKTRIPFDSFSAPLEIRKDISFKKKTHRAETQKEYKEVTSFSDLFYVKGERAEHIYMLGEPGRGKTGQCFQLLHYWLQALDAKREQKELSDWEKGLYLYDLLLFVSLRHVTKGCHSVVDMICRDVLKKFPQHHNTVRQILQGGLKPVKCLIVLDGLDEMNGKPDIDVDITQCTILITSRPWKFNLLSPRIHDKDIVVQVCGLNEDGIRQVISKVLVNYFELDSSADTFKKRRENMFHRATHVKFKSIMNIPLVLTASVHLWQTDISTECSMTSFLALLVNLLIKIAFDNNRVSSFNPRLITKETIDVSGFPLLSGKHALLKYMDVLLSLGKVAHKYQRQIVFEKEGFEKELNDPVRCGASGSWNNRGKILLQFSLDIGLLSQSSAPGSGDTENVSINFFHNTVREFVIALYILCCDEVSIEDFLRSCSSLDSMLEVSSVMMFLVGLDPNLGSKISKQFADMANGDKNVIRYRYYEEITMKKYLNRMSFSNLNIRLLSETVCNLYEEMMYSQRKSPHLEIKNEFHVSDVYLNASSNETIYDCVKNSKSLRLINYGDSVASARKFFDKIERESITSDAARVLQEAIRCNTHLQVLCLKGVLFKSDPNFQELCVDLNDSTRLVRLEIAQDGHCVKGSGISSCIRLVPMTKCVHLTKLILRNVRVQSVDGFQSVIHSFTQLQTLQFDGISFNNIEKCSIQFNFERSIKLSEVFIRNVWLENFGMCLPGLLLHGSSKTFITLGMQSLTNTYDIERDYDYIESGKLCGSEQHSYLTKLTHMDLCLNKIVFLSADRKELIIKNVSCSLRDYLLVFSICKQLTYLEIEQLSVADKEDTEIPLNEQHTTLKLLTPVNLNISKTEYRSANVKTMIMKNVKCSLRLFVLVLCHCEQLVTLKLERLSFEDKEDTEIPLSLRHCKNLERLCLSDLHIRSIEVTIESAANIKEMIIKNVTCSLLSLNLVLCHCKQLVTLELERLSFEDKEDTEIPLSLRHCKNLEKLRLSDIHIRSIEVSTESAASIEEMIIKNVTCSLRSLVLVLCHCKQLVSLEFERLSFEDKENTEIPLSLTHCKNLERLRLSDLHIKSIEVTTECSLRVKRVAGPLSIFSSNKLMIIESIFKEAQMVIAPQSDKRYTVVLQNHENGDINVDYAFWGLGTSWNLDQGTVNNILSNVHEISALIIENIDMGDFPPILPHTTHIGWLQFITNLISIKKYISIRLTDVNIGDELVSFLYCSSSVSMQISNKTGDGERRYRWLFFRLTGFELKKKEI